MYSTYTHTNTHIYGKVILQAEGSDSWYKAGAEDGDKEE